MTAFPFEVGQGCPPVESLFLMEFQFVEIG